MTESKVIQKYKELKGINKLQSDIFFHLYTNCQGKTRSITRAQLLSFCRIFEPETSNREMRRLYSELPVIADEAGIYWPLTKDEVEGYKQYLRKKAFPLFARWNQVAKFHPKLTSKHFQQMEFEWGGKL